MKHILFCCLLGALLAGCLVRVQSQKSDSNANVLANAAVRARGNSNSSGVNTNPYNSGANVWNAANMVANMGSNAVANAILVSRQYASQKRLYDVCGNPRLRCNTSGDFRPEDLPIRIPGELELFGTYKSKPFFAIILESRDLESVDERCATRFTDDDRNNAQKLFADNKVFLSADGCPNFEHAYVSEGPGFYFMAIYAGSTEIQAKALLKKMAGTKKFPSATIRKMQADLCNACP